MPTDPDPTGEPDNPAADVMPYWDQVVEDMAATADEYRDRDWTAREIHPGDVAVRTGDVERTGIELLAPDNEFDPVAAAFDRAGGFGRAEVFRADTGGTIYAVVALEDPETETAVLVPLYFSPGEHEEFVEAARAEGEIRVHVRPLDERRVLTFTIDDPEQVLP
ncbi:DUF7529 family protein [Haloarcula litorea]|uniref:DUF7529 family protein n=1 Tax=Haloarcula litorea TaxID=3032579 RepID=UPI0023E85356|nr:hypothetical protein [Halomicroarcula sp. GDY20]